MTVKTLTHDHKDEAARNFHNVRKFRTVSKQKIDIHTNTHTYFLHALHVDTLPATPTHKHTCTHKHAHTNARAHTPIRAQHINSGMRQRAIFKCKEIPHIVEIIS